MDTSLTRRTVEDACNSDSDTNLIAAAQADPAAFAALYRRHLPAIYRYLRARSSTDEEADDLAQQVFLKALEALPTYENRGLPVIAWLFRIARNASVDASRRKWRTVPLHQAHVGGQAPDLDQPELAALRQEGARQFDAMIAGFDDDHRNLLVLRFAVGLTTREIAMIVGKREAAVRKQLSRALARLKERYDGA